MWQHVHACLVKEAAPVQQSVKVKTYPLVRLNLVWKVSYLPQQDESIARYALVLLQLFHVGIGQCAVLHYDN